MGNLEIGAPINATQFMRHVLKLVPLAGDIGVITEDMRSDGSARVILPYDDSFAQPGGSISGPALKRHAGCRNVYSE